MMQAVSGGLMNSKDSPANGTSATMIELMSGRVGGGFVAPGPHQAFPSSPAFCP